MFILGQNSLDWTLVFFFSLLRESLSERVENRSEAQIKGTTLYALSVTFIKHTTFFKYGRFLLLYFCSYCDLDTTEREMKKL